MGGFADRSTHSRNWEVGDREEVGVGGRGVSGKPAWVKRAGDHMAESEGDVVESVDIKEGNGGRVGEAVSCVWDC